MEARPDLLNVSQAAEMIGISENGVRERIRKGKLAAAKRHGEYEIAAAAVLEGQGLNRALSIYMCQFLVPNILENLSVELSRQVARTMEPKGRELGEKVEALSRALGRAEAMLEATARERDRLAADVEALAGKLGREPRRSDAQTT